MSWQCCLLGLRDLGLGTTPAQLSPGFRRLGTSLSLLCEVDITTGIHLIRLLTVHGESLVLLRHRHLPDTGGARCWVLSTGEEC